LDESMLKHHQVDDGDSDDGTFAREARPFWRVRSVAPQICTTDEESEAGVETCPDEGEPKPRHRRIAHVVDEADSIVTNWDSRTIDPSQFKSEEVDSEGIQLDEALRGHTCNVPGCVLCKIKDEIKWVKPDSPPKSIKKPRGYWTSNTVVL